MALGLLTAACTAARAETEMALPSAVQQTAYHAADQSENGDSGQDAENPPCRWCYGGKLADPWTLPQPDFLKDRNITVGGWLEGGIYANQYGAPFNGPIGLRRHHRRLRGRPSLGASPSGRPTPRAAAGISADGLTICSASTGQQTQCCRRSLLGLQLEHEPASTVSAMPQLYGEDRL